MVKDIYVLWDVVFVICMRNMYGHFVRYVICKMYERYVRL